MEFLKQLLQPSTYEALQSLLGDELSAQVKEKTKDFTVNTAEQMLIPKATFDEAREKAKKAEEQLKEILPKYQELEPKYKEIETKYNEINPKYEALLPEFEKLKTSADTLSAGYKTKLMERAYKDALKRSGAVDERLLTALIDKEKLKYSDEGDLVEGFDEQLSAIKAVDKYKPLFSDFVAVPNGAGIPQSTPPQPVQPLPLPKMF